MVLTMPRREAVWQEAKKGRDPVGNPQVKGITIQKSKEAATRKVTRLFLSRRSSEAGIGHMRNLLRHFKTMSSIGNNIRRGIFA
jgi:hypothetical protein